MITALEEGMKDTTTKERYFLTPTSMGGASAVREYRLKSRSPRRGDSPEKGRDSWENRSKGKGKKGKGKGKKGGRQILSQPYAGWKGHLLRLEQQRSTLSLQLRQGALLPDLFW